MTLIVAAGAGALAGAMDFARDIQPIFAKRCYVCHGEKQQMGGLRLDRREDALRGGYSGTVIRSHDSGGSRLYQLITSGVQAEGKLLTMPLAGPRLTADETQKIQQWIDEGAAWAAELPAARASGSARPKPWSFQPIRRPDPPAVKNTAWPRNAIDSFILAKLEGLGIAPSPEASKMQLVRRLYLDLIGLPPTPEEAAEFIADGRPDAYENLVDKLLQSTHYGEKWARSWLDLARYADSEGGVHDFGRPFAWRYRDWVIDALNRDMPFDQFTIEQLAGDLLPRATLDQKIATGFLRCTVTSREGGIDLEKLRFDQLVDRANTIGTAWLGLTVGCAQCHDHKYDPIKQRDYYRLFAFFENSQEVDLEAPASGELGTYRRYVSEFRVARNKLLAQEGVAEAQTVYEDKLREAAANPGKHPDWDIEYDGFSKLLDHGAKILQTPLAQRTQREQDAITDYFLKSSSYLIGKKRYEELKLKELYEKIKEQWQKYPPLSTVMTVAEDQGGAPSYLRVRGNYKDKGVEVTSGTLESLPALGEEQRANRLSLARWLVARENPLTARVAVNRMWQEFFGRGLVRTSDDFGMQGELPTHPALLDWLASEFVDNGWSPKKMHRLIVLSATYRQASATRPDLVTRDPANTLLARQARFRLPAELIRDAALRSSGLLWDAIGGESVRPPQPDSVADLQYSMAWAESTGKSRYRRGLYVWIQRTATYPLLMNFDAPDRTVSTARRDMSNTPLQALNLMNDPVFVEAAQALAAAALEEPGTDADRIARIYQRCYSREPSRQERELFTKYLERRRAMAQKDPHAAESMPAADLIGVDPAEAVAWYGASRAVLNSDEFLTRE